MLALFPPSSRVAGMSLSAAARLTLSPTSVDPVKASLRKPGWSSMYCPDLEPFPVRMLTTPGGRRSPMTFMSSNALRGVDEELFRTMQSPAARAGASFHATIRNGKFHGTIIPTTPMGSRRMMLSRSPSSTVALPSSERRTPAK